MKHSIIAGLLGLLTLWGCASPITTQGTFRYEKFPAKSEFTVGDLSYRIDDDIWYRAPNVMWNHQRFIQASSPSTSMEVLTKWALIGETTMKRRWADMMPREQAEYWLSVKIAKLAAAGGIVTDSNIELQDWAGRPGYRLTASFTTVQGLDMKMVTYGASYDRFHYVMAYESDTVENYEKSLRSFEAMAKSAKIRQASQ
jgi:hypothetical protein